MEFKFNSRTRIKMPVAKLNELHELFPEHKWFYEFRTSFQHEAGLVMTSIRNTYSRNGIYYFKVVDKNKYFLAKIKYGV
jgi:hypothetical protein